MKDPGDPRNEITGGIQCDFCPEQWPLYQMERAGGDWLCPNCRLKCDYCEYYYPTDEIIKTTDGKACSDCLVDHDLVIDAIVTIIKG